MLFVNSYGVEQRISLADFVDIYVGSAGGDIIIEIGANNVISARLTETFLETLNSKYDEIRNLTFSVNALSFGKANKEDVYTKFDSDERFVLNSTGATYDLTGITDDNDDFESGSTLKRFFSLVVYKFNRLAQVLTDLLTSNNIIDVVQSKSVLNTYDNSKVRLNDIVVVSTDESHGGAKSFYKWIGATQPTRKWTYQFSEPIMASKEYVDGLIGGVTQIIGDFTDVN